MISDAEARHLPKVHFRILGRFTAELEGNSIPFPLRASGRPSPTAGLVLALLQSGTQLHIDTLVDFLGELGAEPVARTVHTNVGRIRDRLQDTKPFQLLQSGDGTYGFDRSLISCDADDMELALRSATTARALGQPNEARDWAERGLKEWTGDRSAPEILGGPLAAWGERLAGKQRHLRREQAIGLLWRDPLEASDRLAPLLEADPSDPVLFLHLCHGLVLTASELKVHEVVEEQAAFVRSYGIEDGQEVREFKAQLGDYPTLKARLRNTYDLERDAPRARATAVAKAPETHEHPGWTAAFAHAAVLLSAERFDDGAWGRSLWHVGGQRFSDDVATHRSDPVPRQRRAVSITSWAALSLRTALGGGAEGHAEAAYQFILRAFDEDTGFFGSLHRLTSQTPMVPDQDFLVSNPRHTASALKLLIERGTTRRGVYLKAAKASIALLNLEASRTGSWGEALRGRGNVLSTAYVADALLQAQEHRGLLTDFLDDRDASFLDASLGSSINNAFRWLSDQQQEDGQWGYRSPEEFPETRPYYTAHVICFLPQLFDSLPTSLRKLRPFLAGVTSLGGVPERVGGEPSLAPTAMVLFGLVRLGDESRSDSVVSDCIEACSEFVLHECGSTDSRSARDLTVMEAIFTLAVAERLGDVAPANRARVSALVTQLDQLRPYDRNPRDKTLLARIDEVLAGGAETRLKDAFRARLADTP